MKKVKTIALLSAVCISTAAFTGCTEIPGALMYASAPHISEDSELVTESMKIQEKYFDKDYVTFKPDKSVKSRSGKIDDIINSKNYTLKTYSFSEGYTYDDYDWDLTYPEDEIETYVYFTKEVVSDKNSWTITGCYYIDKDKNPVIDKKTYYGAYDEDIIIGGHEYHRNDINRAFYMYEAAEFENYYDTQQTPYGKSVATGKVTIDSAEYDAEIVSYNDYASDEYYDDSDEDIIYDEYDDYEAYCLLIYDDENNLIIENFIDQEETTAAAIAVDLDYADFLVYEQNADNSSIIQKPKSYITLDEYHSGIFY